MCADTFMTLTLINNWENNGKMSFSARTPKSFPISVDIALKLQNLENTKLVSTRDGKITYETVIQASLTTCDLRSLIQCSIARDMPLTVILKCLKWSTPLYINPRNRFNWKSNGLMCVELDKYKTAWVMSCDLRLQYVFPNHLCFQVRLHKPHKNLLILSEIRY